MKLKLLSILVAASATTSAFASEEEQKTWEITSEVGAIITSGNTETTTLKGGIKALHNLENWNNEYKVDGLYKEDEVENEAGAKETQRTNEKYSLSAQGNYKLNEDHSHLYIYGSYVSDYFGAYRNEAVISAGYGQRFIDRSDMWLNAEIGPGYKHFEFPEGSVDENGIPNAGDTDSEVIALGKLDYNWQISDKSPRIDEILPSMKTDIIIDNRSSDKRLVIDTKFNAVTTKGWHREETLRSGYIYQMYTYLRSQEDTAVPTSLESIGMLLHPTVGKEIAEMVTIQGHPIWFCTVNLGESAISIRERLLILLQKNFQEKK